jgi:type IV secretion system protein VirD4
MMDQTNASAPSGGGLVLGRYYDDASQRVGDKIVFDGERHGLIWGPNGSGKATRWLVPNLLTSTETSCVVVDPKGELFAITSDYRRTVSDVVVLNPFKVLGFGSNGFNPLAALDPRPDSPNFYDDAAALGEALIEIQGNDPHWSESARSLLVALLMWVKITKGDKASLVDVRRLLTEAERYEQYTVKEDPKPGEEGAAGKDGKVVKKRERLVSGLRFTAGKMADSDRFEIASLAARFTGQTSELSSIRSVCDTQTRWMLSKPMREDLVKSGVDFRCLKERPTTVYVILPAERLRTHNVWLRLVITSILRALYKPGGLRTRLFLDELPALGRLGPLEDAFGLVRGYRTQIIGICQDLAQLKILYKDRWESFVANAGFVQAFAPNDLTTARWISERAGKTTVIAPAANERHSSHGGDPSEGLSWSQVGRPLYLPHELMGFEEGTGLLFLSGMANGVRFFAPPYWKITQCAERAGRNPYFEG